MFLQILTLSVTAFKKDLFVAFMLIVNNLLDLFEVVNQKCGYFVAQFKAAYNHLNYVFERFDVRFYTEQVQEQDKKRTSAFRQLKDVIRYNFIYPVDDEKSEAARILLKVIELYSKKDIAQLKMNERTAVLSNIVEDFENKYQAQIELVGAGELLTKLKQEQSEFLSLYEDRLRADAEIGLKAMADARVRMTDAYRNLVNAVNLAAMQDDDGEFDEFIKTLNVEIRRNFVNTGQSGSGSSAGSEGEETIPYKFANFVYVGGTELKLPFEVGAPIVPPENTPGYVWPDLPETMPKRSFTVREVPIEEAMATATFHFFDHREEELRQLVGSILHAPENTAGYYWDPTVPETMPAEDTNYYELPISVELDPALNITIKFRGTDNQILHEMVVPVDYQMTEEEFPTPPEGTHWNFTLADLNLAIGMKNPGDTITVRAQA